MKAAWMLSLALFASPVIAQTTKPATAPVADRRSGIDLAMAALDQGDFKRAADLAAQESADSMRAGVKASDPVYANAAHVQGVALLKLGQPKQAAAALQRCYRDMSGNRSMLFNVSLSDVLGEEYIDRAVTNLQAYCVAHPTDEQMVNLWGMAIDALSRKKSTKKVDDAIVAYGKVDRQLEATRPGEHRWGTNWISEAKFAEIEKARLAAEPRIRTAERKVTDYEELVRKADRDLADASKASQGTSTASEAKYEAERRKQRIQDASDRLRAMQIKLAQSQEDLAAAKARLPRPEWNMRMDPLEIELKR